MKVKIKKDAVLKKTRQQNRRNPQYIPTPQERSYNKSLIEVEGHWVTVETEFLFENQFNVVENNLRIMATDCDDIDFEEIESFEKYKELVTARCEKNCPGRGLNFYQIAKILYAAGKGECPEKPGTSRS